MVRIPTRRLQVAIQLAPNTGTNQPSTFAESGTDTVTIASFGSPPNGGLRISAQVQNSGSPADGRAQVKIWGMTPSLMNQLSTLGLVFNLVPKNVLTLSAGDDVNGLSTAFTGTIWSAWGDYSSMPSTPFVLECLIGAADAVLSVPATSYQGAANVADVASGLARQMNLGFVNFGVSGQLRGVYLRGSAKNQLEVLAQQAGFLWGYVNGGAAIGIWPRTGTASQQNQQVPIISKQTGMITSPSFTQQGIVVKTLHNPQIAFGGLVEVRSSVLAGIASAQGQTTGSLATPAKPVFPTQWAVNKIDLALDALVPNGNWMDVVYAYNPGFAQSILPPR